MLTTKMSALNNTGTNFFQPPNDKSLSRSESIQLPPLSRLLNNESTTPVAADSKDTLLSSSSSNSESGSISPHSASRLPSISDIISPDQHNIDTAPHHSKVINTPVRETKPSTAASSEKKAYAFISHSPATFPSHEPSIDNAQLARRKRRRTSPNELTILQHEFEMGHTPNKARRQEIASRVNMTEKAVQIWFQNKRQALRKLQLNDQSLHQTTTITLPEVDVVTSPIRSTPTKYYENSMDSSFSTSPVSANSNLPVELPLVTAPHQSDIRSSPPQNYPQLPPPKPVTWTMMTPAKLTPVTPVRTRYQTPYHQLPTPNIMSFRLNKRENNGKPIQQFNNTLPTPSYSQFSHQKPMMKVAPLDTNARSPSPADTKVKSMMSLTNLNSPLPTKADVVSRKRIALGDITNIQLEAKPKHAKKKEGEFECVENLLSLRTGNWK